MEMPDGFERLAGLKKSLPYDTIIWTSVEDRENILSLMKEMAEALEFASQYHGCILNGSEQEMVRLKMKNALHKFMEWK